MSDVLCVTAKLGIEPPNVRFVPKAAVSGCNKWYPFDHLIAGSREDFMINRFLSLVAALALTLRHSYPRSRN